MTRTRWLVMVLALGFAACGKSTQPAADDKRPGAGDATTPPVTGSSDNVAGSAGSAGSGSSTVMKTPGSGSAATFVKGSALSPSKDLLEWLGKQKVNGQPRLLRLPLVLTKGPTGFDVSKARLGNGADALVVYANDASLGVGLAMRANQACKDSGATTCAFWVEGYWNEKSLAGGPELDVKKAEPLAAGDLASATHAEVEGESGN